MLHYDGKKIIPAPLVTLNKTYRKDKNDGSIGALYTIQLNGTLLPFRGSPSGNYDELDTAFWQLGGYPPDEIYTTTDDAFNHILRKQEAIRGLFSQDGKSLEWQSNNGLPVVKCNPRVLSINFEEGRSQWADGCDYSIDLEADWIYVHGTSFTEDDFPSDLIESSTESWAFENIEGFYGSGYRVNRTLSAQGIRGFDENGDLFDGKEAWHHARDFINSRSSGVIDQAFLANAIGLSGWFGGEYTRVPSVNKTDGTYELRESWIIHRSADVFIGKTFGVDFNAADNTYVIRYDGTINGFTVNDTKDTTSSINNAISSVPSDMDARSEASGFLSSFLAFTQFPQNPSSKSIQIDKVNGSVIFNFLWDTSQDGISGVFNEFSATSSIDASSLTDTISLTQRITSNHPDINTRLSLTKGAVLSDNNAYIKAFNILGLVPVAPQLGMKSRSISVNERNGDVSVSWSWDTSSTTGTALDITITEDGPSDIIAVINVPGVQLPVIQNMQAKTPRTVTRVASGTGFVTKPSFPFITSGEIIIAKSESFSEATGRYEARLQTIHQQ